MMKSEFIERTGFEPTGAEYEEIEAEYMGCDMDKDQFCKMWKKNGGIQRLSRLRARRIEELEGKVVRMEKDHEEEVGRRCAEYNFTIERLKAELKDACDTLDQESDRRMKLYNELEETKRQLAEMEEKIETIRSAFSILGIAKEA